MRVVYHTVFDSSLRPNNFERRKALIDGICEMLWQAGEKRRCCLALLEQEACFGPDYRYRFDNVTERVGQGWPIGAMDLSRFHSRKHGSRQ